MKIQDYKDAMLLIAEDRSMAEWKMLIVEIARTRPDVLLAANIEVNGSTDEKIKAIRKSKGKIAAIKAYRGITGADLATSKEFVEAL